MTTRAADSATSTIEAIEAMTEALIGMPIDAYTRMQYRSQSRFMTYVQVKQPCKTLMSHCFYMTLNGRKKLHRDRVADRCLHAHASTYHIILHAKIANEVKYAEYLNTGTKTFQSTYASLCLHGVLKKRNKACRVHLKKHDYDPLWKELPLKQN